MDDEQDGQYGDYLGLKVGQRTKVSASVEVMEVGTNYATVQTDDGDELDINFLWDTEEE